MQNSPKIDRTKWHKPTYLGHYDENASHYEGIRCYCKKCGLSFVFSAESQKNAFEVEHRYPGWLPTLCPMCSEQWERLKQDVIRFENLWESNHSQFASDQAFLKNWLASLQEAQKYGKKDFGSRICMLVKAIAHIQSSI
ncbi:hypothetical protein ABHF33_10865 [Chitinibacter sp. FCG-7]|uniref:Zinc-binding domain-containing protein n=1 Tax=Chitinibacter mangrovi TaxID=3153927 RepID=A0AAU7F6U7_9NEIS